MTRSNSPVNAPNEIRFVINEPGPLLLGGGRTSAASVTHTSLYRLHAAPRRGPGDFGSGAHPARFSLHVSFGADPAAPQPKVQPRDGDGAEDDFRPRCGE